MTLYQGEYIIVDPSDEEIWFIHTQNLIAECANKKNWKAAQNLALYWAEGVCEAIGLPKTDNWKFFKRSVAYKWFGQPEHKRFLPCWTIEEAIAYAEQFPDRSIRFSVFPKDIACHAKSYRLPVENKQKWADTLLAADNTVEMEMFPEASTPNTICFRRRSSFLGEDTTYEAGKGQAMFVFEQERGMHPVISADKQVDTFVYTIFSPQSDSVSILVDIRYKLEKLIDIHDKGISAKCFGLCRKLGIGYTSIEGYFDFAQPEKYLIVDIDLPFDVVFMPTS